jgi:hypothetical protein
VGERFEIKNARMECSEERPVLTVSEVFVLADVVPRRFRALVLLAVFGSTRWGELAAFRRHSLDLTARTVKIEASVIDDEDGKLVTGWPKSDGGTRILALPGIIEGRAQVQR